YSFVVADTMHEILIPLLITHGLSYMALIQESSKKVFSKNKILGIVLLSLMGGFLDWFFLDEKFLFNHSLFFHHFFRAMIFGAIFTHYYLDGKIWKKDHPHFELIFKEAATS
ncbi:MAG: hypothetical protein NXH75_13875, partial [Halobacteriovoraceae bacterium]|nr:hypothetical protein [Halobacteriovoraceae bacterium]